jgi:hypothetical protein
LLPNRRLAPAIPAALGRALLLALMVDPAFAESGRGPLSEGRSSLGPASRAAWLQRVEQARTRYEAFVAQARLSIHPRVREPGIAPGRTYILDDPTLRRGDVVVTSDGLMVFRGSRRFPYTSDDFDPVASPATAGARHAPELIELQRAHEQGKR